MDVALAATILPYFYPRSPCGERPNIRSSDKKALDFYPRSPCGERQLSACYCLRCNPISIHALLAESDVHLVLRGGQLGNFYPRSPCGERRIRGGMFDNTLDISIHALLAESDPKTDQDKRITQLISIHALLAESDRLAPRSRDNSMDFYPRSPCGERQRRREELASAIRISIHALLAESDGSERILWPVMRNFYPRSPCGERRAVSITGYLWSYFYPRSPCGERPEADIQDRIAEKFLSTLSLRRATIRL